MALATEFKFDVFFKSAHGVREEAIEQVKATLKKYKGKSHPIAISRTKSLEDILRKETA